MLIFTDHARDRMTVRQIDHARVEATVDQPERSEPDPHDPALTRAWRRSSAAAPCGLSFAATAAISWWCLPCLRRPDDGSRNL
jgi:hypothetical protein